MARRGFTILELLVVMAVLGVVLALLLPAIQHTRESSRRLHCQNNLKQLGLAIHNYHDVYQRFPPGNQNRASLFVGILAQMDLAALRSRFPGADPLNPMEELKRVRVPGFLCPSDSAANTVGAASYAGNYGSGYKLKTSAWNGVFGSVYHPIRAFEVRDGFSQTAAISECLIGNGSRQIRRAIWETPKLDFDLAQFAQACRSAPNDPGLADTVSKQSDWTEGQPGNMLYNHLMFPNDCSCKNNGSQGAPVTDGGYAASSDHGKGVNLLKLDSSVVFIATDIDIQVWRAYGSRDGGESFQ